MICEKLNLTETPGCKLTADIRYAPKQSSKVVVTELARLFEQGPVDRRVGLIDLPLRGAGNPSSQGCQIAQSKPTETETEYKPQLV